MSPKNDLLERPYRVIGWREHTSTVHTLSGREPLLPDLYRPGIQMDKIRFGIVADPAAAEVYSYLAKCGGLVSGDSDVDGTALHMQAFRSYTCSDFSQCFIRARRTVAGNDAEGGAWLFLHDDAMKQIQQVGVNRPDLSGAVIAHDMTDSVHCTMDQIPVGAVAGFKGLPGVNIIERQYAVFMDFGIESGQYRACEDGCQDR